MEHYPDVLTLIEGLRQELTELRAENAALKQEDAALKEEVADLRRQLAKNSSNSSKPPSSDGSGKKLRIAGSLRGVQARRVADSRVADSPGIGAIRCARWPSRTRSNAMK
jgi:hypothetical protein